MNTVVQFSPLLSFALLAALLAAALALAAVAFWRRLGDFYARAVFLAALALLLLNPLVVHEKRQPLPDRLLIVIDESPSQSFAARNEAAEKALAHIKSMLAALPQVEPVIIRAGQDPASQKNQNTSLFAALRESLLGMPAGQVAGTVLISDGQVHDVPESLRGWEKLAPFHVVLTGRKDERDRKVAVIEAPKYSLLNQDVTVKVRVDDIGRGAGGPVTLDIRQNGQPFEKRTVTAGAAQSVTFRIDHPGQNVFEFSVPVETGELTPANNTAAVIVNGVRDRLRVLLVSGVPHVGERAWRDLLKSDPSIDLVHFTILRSPLSFDSTPNSELALIAFPVEELFEKKIKDFDLIIFDKYAQYGLLQQQYFANIAAFVRAGGAFLLALGPDKLELSLFQTALGGILPVAPRDQEQSLVSGRYLPELTDLGKAHPVTADLKAAAAGQPWGSWFTQVDVSRQSGDVLMTGNGGRPLLILDKAGEGRVAVLASDNIWLWAKGVDGGGPYTELLRHVAHWLMKEPELEEDFIKAEARDHVISVAERTPAGSAPKPMTMTRPDGQDEAVQLQAQDKGWAGAKVIAAQNGIYRFTNGARTAFAVVGTAVSEEFSELHTTADRLEPLVEAGGGTVIWYNETPQFSLRRVSAGNSRFGGKDWIGLKANGASNVSSVESAALLPNWLSLLVIFAGLLAVWRREGGGSR